MKNEKIDMSRESDTFHVSQDGVYTITGTNSRHGITVSAGVRATIFLQDVNLCDLGDMGVAFHIAENCHITVILEGNNILHSGREMAAIQLRKQSVLNIKGNGKLIAYGGEGAAGIAADGPGSGSDHGMAYGFGMAYRYKDSQLIVLLPALHSIVGDMFQSQCRCQAVVDPAPGLVQIGMGADG